MGLDVNPAHFAGDPAFTTGLPANSVFQAAIEAVLDARYPREIQRQTSTSTADISPVAGNPTIFTVTFTAVASHKYRIRCQMHLAMGAAVNTAQVSINDNGGTVLEKSTLSLTNTYAGAIYLEHEVTPGAGSVTYTLHASCGGTAALTGDAGGGGTGARHHWVTVDDVGV